RTRSRSAGRIRHAGSWSWSRCPGNHGRMRSLIIIVTVLGSLSACVVEEHELVAASAAAELEASATQITTIRSFPSAIHGMAVTDTGRLYFTDSFGTMGAAKRSL